MKYMVMECHPGYAVVLGDDGRSGYEEPDAEDDRDTEYDEHEEEDESSDDDSGENDE